MSIILNPVIKSKIESYLKEVKNYSEKKTLLENPLEIIEKITLWKFSKGIFFYPVPYQYELDGYPPPRLLKKQYNSINEAEKNKAYSFGFIGTEHRVTITPRNMENQLLVATLTPISDAIRIQNVFYRDYKNKIFDAPSLGEIFKISSNLQGDILVGSSGTYRASLYQYNENKLLVKSSRYNSGWSKQENYNYIYDDSNQLLKIVSESSNLPIWQKP